MPANRDGRGVLTVEYNEPPPAVPPGPVERGQVSEARMADFAAERAARAQPAVAAPAPAKPKTRALNPARTAVRAERVTRYLDAIRASDSHREAAERLGVGKHSLEMFVSDLRRRRELPEDVEQLLRQRNPARRGHVPAPKTNGAAKPQTEPQDQEASAPATAAVTVEQPERDGSTVGSTPPDPLPVIPRSAVEIEEAIDGTVLHLIVRIDAAELARAMDGWPNYAIQPFVDGLARIVAAAKA